MTIFSDHEYEDFDARPDRRDAWARLPVLVTIDGLPVRYLGPLVDLGHDGWLEDLGHGAWGYLEECGWAAILSEGGPAIDEDGKLRDAFCTAFGRAVRRLAEEGRYAGPTGDVEVWASWVALVMTEPGEYVKALARAAGALR